MNNINHTLQTQRLTLKRLEPSDHSFILNLVNTKGWLEFIGDRNINNETDALNYIDNINGNDNLTYWVVSLKNDTKIGVVTLIKRDYLEYHDIGFAFLPSYHRNGYAYEASKVVLDCIEESTDVQTILATTALQNTSSVKLLEKLGLTFYKINTLENNEEVRLFKVDLDKVKIDKLVKDFFSVFTNKDANPNLELLYKICIDGTIIIKNTNGLCETYNLDTFITPRKELLTNGSLIHFEEIELKENTTITRNIAERISQYEKKGILNDQLFSEKGTKMFQFVKIGNGWKICSVIWDDK